MQLDLALDRCGGRWEFLAAELVAFEPNHRARIRSIKLALERRADDRAATLERQRVLINAEASIVASLLDKSYPSTPRSDREIQKSSPSPDPSVSSAFADMKNDGFSRERSSYNSDVDLADESIVEKCDGYVHASSLPLGGTNVSFNATSIAVDSEPTLLWKSIDAAVASNVTAGRDAIPSSALGSSVDPNIRYAAAVASGTWGSEGFPTFSWKGEFDPLRFGHFAADVDCIHSADNHVDSRTSDEEAPLRDVVFRLFNDAADAALADAAAQRRRATG